MADPERAAGRRRRRRQLDYGMLPELLGYQLRRAQLAVFHDFMRDMQGLSVTPGQFGVLVLIEANPGLNQSELGQALGVDRSTVVAVLDRLEAAGLAVRGPSPDDRRSHALTLSPAGAALLARVKPKVRTHEARLARELNPQEQRQLLRLLRRIGGG